jgi:hypothetical protein
MQTISKYAQVIPVNIDNPQARDRILQSKIKNVPAIIVQTPSKIDVFEGKTLVDFINKLMQIINTPKGPPMPQAGHTTLMPSPQMVQTIVSPQDMQPQQAPPPTVDNLNATMNNRLQPIQIDNVQEQRTAPILSNQIASTTATQQANLLQQQHQNGMMPPQQMMQQQPPMMPQQPPMMQSTPMMPQPQMLTPNVPMGQGGSEVTMLDDSILSGGGSGIISDISGYTQDQIGVKPKSGGTGSAKASAEMMQMEREETDKQYARR